jgi:hypothetical protein
MKKIAAAAMLIGMLGPSARAQTVPQIIDSSTLMKQTIGLASTAPNGGITGVTRDSSGKVVAIKLEGAASYPTTLAPAVVSPAAAVLKPAAGLAPKRVKSRGAARRNPKRAIEHLRRSVATHTSAF